MKTNLPRRGRHDRGGEKSNKPYTFKPLVFLFIYTYICNIKASYMYVYDHTHDTIRAMYKC